MSRLAVFNAGSKLPLYVSAVSRTNTFRVTHLIASSINGSLASQASADNSRADDVIDSARILSDVLELSAAADDFDACVVHGPLSECRAIVQQMTAAKKHILLDLTGIPNLDELRLLAATCQAAGVCLAVTQPSYFSPYAMEVRESLNAGHLGRLGLVRVHCWESAAPKEDVDRVISQMLVQEIDLVCSLFGKAPSTLFSQRFQSGADEGTPQGQCIHLQFPTGMALIDCALYDESPYYTLSAIGSNGAAYGDDHHNSNLLIKRGTHSIRVADEKVTWRIQLESFLTTIARSHSDRSVENVTRAISVYLAATESAKTNRMANFVESQEYELQ